MKQKPAVRSFWLPLSPSTHPSTHPAQVDALEQRLAQLDSAPLEAELEAAQARLRHAQAACGTKEAALRELRERLEQQTR